MVPPTVLTSPYDSVERDIVLAIAPFINDSGTSVADPLAIGDAFVAQVTEVRGISALPLNATIRAMERLEMGAVRTPGDARLLASALNADGVIVGVITAYQPYDPPRLGLTVAVHLRDDPGQLASAGVFDPAGISMAPTDRNVLSRGWSVAEPSVIARHFDAAGHDVQMDVQRYATGRHDYDSALGWRRYMASMELFTRYAAHATVRELLDAERRRMSRARMAGVENVR